MKFRERILLIIMIIVFITSLGMFYYQNIYTSNQVDKSKIEALVAVTDINIGTSINEKNTKLIKVDKDLLSPKNVIKKEEVLGMNVTNKILAGELINKDRLTKEKKVKDNINTYLIELNPDYRSEVSNGDLIRAYVQIVDKEGNISNKLIFDKKEIIKISTAEGTNALALKQSSGGILIEATDKEAISYYNAKQKGKVVVLKYKEPAEKSDYVLPFLEISN